MEKKQFIDDYPISSHMFPISSYYFQMIVPYEGFLSHRGTPFHHPFIGGILHEINHGSRVRENSEVVMKFTQMYYIYI